MLAKMICMIMMDFDKVYFELDVYQFVIYLLVIYKKQILFKFRNIFHINLAPNAGDGSRFNAKESVEPINALPVSCQF
jgi:hypothetical protein